MFRNEFQDSSDVLSLSIMEKCISTEADMPFWLVSPAYSKLITTLNKLKASVESVLRTDARTVSENVTKIINIIDKCTKLTEKYKCTDLKECEKQYNGWLTEVFESRVELFKGITDDKEIMDYFCQSFGSWTRVDYGTGHELNFLAFVTALFEKGYFKDDDAKSVVLDLFWKYWDLVVHIIAVYNLEPAGSRGVWGLDDYIFLPFLFGASQLVNSRVLTPCNVTDAMTAKEHSNDNSYSRWINHVRSVKVGDFEQYARYLYSLQAVPTFTKLSNGLVKMYQGEVLNCLPVVQHFRFGKILSWK